MMNDWRLRLVSQHPRVFLPVDLPRCRRQLAGHDGDHDCAVFTGPLVGGAGEK
jgi:hypothetical protein